MLFIDTVVDAAVGAGVDAVTTDGSTHSDVSVTGVIAAAGHQ